MLGDPFLVEATTHAATNSLFKTKTWFVDQCLVLDKDAVTTDTTRFVRNVSLDPKEVCHSLTAFIFQDFVGISMFILLCPDAYLVIFAKQNVFLGWVIVATTVAACADAIVQLGGGLQNVLV